jgi:uncharacterized protein involved in exopolysaccharide biosynthesis
MYDSFDAFEYLEFLRRRWRVFVAALSAAVLIALPVSLLLPKRYTATASVVIEPPGGNDVRVGTAVSAVYLESLKTYESFASSDSLFARAAEQFHLRDSSRGQAIESLKRQVLKVTKIRDTKILEINVTLPDPRKAQQVAQFLADQTVSMSRTGNQASDSPFIAEAQKQAVEARARLERTQKSWALLSAAAPIASLQSEIDAAVELQGELRQELVDAQATAAEYQQDTGQFAREQMRGAQARATLIEKRIQDLSREIQQKSATLAKRTAEGSALQTDLTVAQKAYETDTARLREMRATAGAHAEQLRVIDPGIVPQQPSSPHIQLNIAAALLVALIASLVYLSIAFVYRRRTAAFEPAMSRGMRA